LIGSEHAVQDEFEDYYNSPSHSISISSLQWWCGDGQRSHWPRVSLMAIDILSIPAMSDEPERVFSGARQTISWDRAQLGDDNIKKVECLKQ
jgi:hypothetical protein